MRKDREKSLLSANAECGLSLDARYALRLARFTHLYWLLVSVAGVICAAAVVLAIVADVLVGLCLAVVAAVGYHYVKKLALSHLLGLSCCATESGLCIRSASAMGENTLYLPSRIMGMRVCALGAELLAGNGNDSLENICFLGSPHQWESISAACACLTVPVTCDVCLPDPTTLGAASHEDAETEVEA